LALHLFRDNLFLYAIKSVAFGNRKVKEVNVFHEEETVKTNLYEKPLEKDIDLWKVKLFDLLTRERLYENPKLTLSDVAEKLNTNTKIVSSVVNAGFQMNFNDFVNHHRIEAVKVKLQNNEHKTTTLLGIAFDCGFNSKATFNRAFKKSTSLSPKDYISKLS